MATLRRQLGRRRGLVRAVDAVDVGPDPAGLRVRRVARLGPAGRRRGDHQPRRPPAARRRARGHRVVRVVPHPRPVRRGAAVDDRDESDPGADAAPGHPGRGAGDHRRRRSARAWRCTSRWQNGGGGSRSRCWRGRSLLVGAGALWPAGDPVGSVRIAVVQGGGPQGTRFAAGEAPLVFERHLVATRSISADDGIEVVLWPENAINVDGTFADSPWGPQISAEAVRLGASIIVGVVEDAAGRSGCLLELRHHLRARRHDRRPLRQGATGAVR